MDQDQAPVHIFLNKQTRDWGEAPAEDQLIFCSIKAISSMGQAITHTPAPAPADTALYIGNSRHSCTGHQVIFMGKGADLHYLKSLKAKQMLNAYYSQSHTHTLT